MQIDITTLFNTGNLMLYSTGDDRSAKVDANMPDSQYSRSEFMDYLVGDWTKDELMSQSDIMLKTLMLQCIEAAVDDADIMLNEPMGTDAWWMEYDEVCDAGFMPHRLIRSGDKIYFLC